MLPILCSLKKVYKSINPTKLAKISFIPFRTIYFFAYEAGYYCTQEYPEEHSYRKAEKQKHCYGKRFFH